MTSSPTVNKVVWLKKHWRLRQNPFPAEAIARLGGEDDRENGLLFDPVVQANKVDEAIDKFVLGSVFSGLKFGFLWSLGTGVSSDARGFGKSSMMQFLVERINADWGRSLIVRSGLDESDATENPVCAVLASFDMANARSLNAVFFEAARYACRFKGREEDPTLSDRLRDRLIERVGSDKPEQLRSAVEAVQENLRGRTLGPLVGEFLDRLLDSDTAALSRYVDGITPTKRTRSGAEFLATLLAFTKAAGISHVMLFCDQLEDFAATTTTRQKRTLEIERFRDYILELQPMSDMLSCIVTMHPRATQAIGDMWALADLPSYDHTRGENQQRVVVLELIRTPEQAKALLVPYLHAFRADAAEDDGSLYPFAEESIQVLLDHSDRKPRDILRKAFALIEQGAQENWEEITGKRAAKLLESFGAGDDEFVPALRAVQPDEDMWG